MGMTLRPIGTEFEVEYPPSESSTDPYPHVNRYRVAAHVWVSLYEGDPNPRLREELKCVSRERSITK